MSVEACSAGGALVHPVVSEPHTGVCLTRAPHVAWMVMGIMHARLQVDGAWVSLRWLGCMRHVAAPG